MTTTGVIIKMTEIKMINFSTDKKLILNEDATKLYQFILPILENDEKKDEKIVLNLAGIDYGISSYYNTSICLFYKTIKDLDARIEIINASETEERTIKKAMANAKAFYSNPDNFVDIDEV
jgi:hypothetical protein